MHVNSYTCDFEDVALHSVGSAQLQRAALPCSLSSGHPQLAQRSIPELSVGCTYLVCFILCVFGFVLELDHRPLGRSFLLDAGGLEVRHWHGRAIPGHVRRRCLGSREYLCSDSMRSDCRGLADSHEEFSEQLDVLGQLAVELAMK